MDKKLKKGITAAAVSAMGSCILLPALTVMAAPAVQSGWTSSQGQWYYYKNGIKVVNEWKSDTHGWCYLGADGAWVKNSLQTDANGLCFIGADGYWSRTSAWRQDSATKAWCFIGANGYAVKNAWKQDSQGWCYLDANGIWVTNDWVKDSNGWCFIGTNGYWNKQAQISAGNNQELNDGATHAGVYQISSLGTFGSTDASKRTVINGNVNINYANGLATDTITLQNLIINGKLTVNFGAGSLNLHNVKVTNVDITNVGSHSLLADGDSELGTVTSNDSDNDAHLIVGGNASIGNAILHSGGTLEVAGGATNPSPFGHVILDPPRLLPPALEAELQALPQPALQGYGFTFVGAFPHTNVDALGQLNLNLPAGSSLGSLTASGSLNLSGGGSLGTFTAGGSGGFLFNIWIPTVGTLFVNSPGSQFNVPAGTTLGTFNANAAGTVTGGGTILNANFGASGCNLQTPPTHTSVLAGVTAYVGGQVADSSNSNLISHIPATGEALPPPPPTGGGSSSISVSAITGADVGVTTGSIKLGYTFAAGNTPITFAQAQTAPYYLDMDASTVSIHTFNPNGPSLASAPVSLSSFVIGDNGQVIYTDFAAIAAAFGNITNGPTGIELHLASKTSVNGVSVNNPWTLNTGYIAFDSNELNVFNEFAATAPTSVTLGTGSTASVGGVTNVAIPANYAADTTGAVTGWVNVTADKIKFTVASAAGTVSTIKINGQAYTSGTDYTIATATPLPIVVTTTQTGKMPAIRIFTVAVAAVPIISTTLTIAEGDVNPDVVVTLANDTFTADGISNLPGNWTGGVGTTGLAGGTITRNSDTQMTFHMNGTAAAGTLTIQANAAALTSGVSSNTLTVSITHYSATLISIGATGHVGIAENAAGFNVVGQSTLALGTLYVVPFDTVANPTAIAAAAIGSTVVTSSNTDTTINVEAAKVSDAQNYVLYAVAGIRVSNPIAAFTADLTAPTVDLTKFSAVDKASPTEDQLTGIAAAVGEAGATVKAYLWTDANSDSAVDSGELSAAVALGVSAADGAVAPTNIGDLALGTYKYVITATDAAGNESVKNATAVKTITLLQ